MKAAVPRAPRSAMRPHRAGAPPTPKLESSDDAEADAEVLFGRLRGALAVCGDAARRVAAAAEALDTCDPGMLLVMNKAVWPPAEWNSFLDDLALVLPNSRVKDPARLKYPDEMLAPPAPRLQDPAAHPIWDVLLSLKEDLEKYMVGGETPEEVEMYGEGDTNVFGKGSSGISILLSSLLRYHVPPEVAVASGIGPLVALLKDHPLRMVSHRATQIARAPAWKGCCRLSATSGLVKTYRGRNYKSEGLEADVRAVVSDLIRAAQEAEAARISADLAAPTGADLPLEPPAA